MVTSGLPSTWHLTAGESATVAWRPNPGLDLHRPSSARIHDVLLGGKDNFAVDRRAGEELLLHLPEAQNAAVHGRAFVMRAVRWLASERGVRQFLDIGAGLPAPRSPALHEVVEPHQADARVVYVDNDPMVVTHGQARMTGSPHSRTAHIGADLRDPAGIVNNPVLRSALDLKEPVAVVLGAVLPFVPDSLHPHGAVAWLLGRLPTGSHLVISHVCSEWNPTAWDQACRVYRRVGIPFQVRSRVQILAFLEALEVLDPGVVPVHRWRPDADADLPVREVSCLGAVARRP